ncbi:zinc finger CCHC domain-containing protein 8-like isoform X2 [Hibiscus syriacus]|nr:zinc finger CCHC domain-containing protein 8-like isoform X2 [Hibiscus syriacus]XP_039027797.1 zinc finger CCHC domain-containing protein 8-like isoform X2 [Hibiscus syriacus]
MDLCMHMWVHKHKCIQVKRRTFLLCVLVQRSPLLWNPLDAEFIPLDSNIVPLYDRGFAMGLTSADASSNLEGGPEIKEASRCFNCGSYSHSLKQCPKPRDSVAFNNARKQHQKLKHIQNVASRYAVRYYQSTQGGKYDDIKPGVLGAETRELLGLGEFDPPQLEEIAICCL